MKELGPYLGSIDSQEPCEGGTKQSSPVPLEDGNEEECLLFRRTLSVCRADCHPVPKPKDGQWRNDSHSECDTPNKIVPPLIALDAENQ